MRIRWKRLDLEVEKERVRKGDCCEPRHGHKRERGGDEKGDGKGHDTREKAPAHTLEAGAGLAPDRPRPGCDVAGGLEQFRPHSSQVRRNWNYPGRAGEDMSRHSSS
jgi:hypothetical protein